MWRRLKKKGWNGVGRGSGEFRLKGKVSFEFLSEKQWELWKSTRNMHEQTLKLEKILGCWWFNCFKAFHVCFQVINSVSHTVSSHMCQADMVEFKPRAGILREIL
jgi:hypothetical protein